MQKISYLLFFNGLEHLTAISDPLITSINENLVLFFVVAIAVLALVVLLYLRQWQRIMAIVRALGAPSGKVLPKLFVPIFFIWIPAIATGAAAVWFLTLGIIWLPVMAAAIAALTFTGILVYGSGIARRLLLGQVRDDIQKHAGSGQKVTDPGEVPGGFVPGNINASAISYIGFMQKTKGNAISAALVHSLRHTFRSPAKYLLITGLALFFVLSLGWLYGNINFMGREAGHLPNEAVTVISAYIVRSPEDDRQFGNWQKYFAAAPISQATLDIVTTAGLDFADNIYLEAMWQFSFLRHPSDYHMAQMQSVEGISHIIAGVSHLDIWAGDIEIEFAAGYGMDNFVFDSPYTPIPVIVQRELLSQENLTLGGEGVFVESFYTVEITGHARIIGVFDGGLSHAVNGFGDVRGSVIMPLEALRHKTYEHWLFENWDTGGLTYITARIDLNSADSRQLDDLHHATGAALSQNNLGQWIGPMPLALLTGDDALNMTNPAMEENLALFRMLFPVAISVSIALAMGTSILFMMQNAKYAAIMCIMGKPGRRVVFALCIKQILVSIAGVALGLASLFAIHLYAGRAVPSIATLIIAGLYFAGAVVGSIIGAIVTSTKTPLELLLVRDNHP